MAKIKLFAVLKKVAGMEEIELQVGEGMKLKDVLLQIKGEFPQVVDLIKEKKVMVSVNQENQILFGRWASMEGASCSPQC